ncbi:RNA-binding S4 domain-containing protein [Jannaschia sp. LMIT008]|uniref:RNA-binding S4 domain-containing protein n=1 Tax=Jannaschia maritima TaxID=3032585 RepID=UPI0028125314|nr:RNA-binding S4 domain-containing protein [Jannaschia sp. LMIT008]
MTDPLPRLRIDKWLWHARFFKTRSLAARVVSDGGVRIDGDRASKPSQTVSPGAVLTFPQGRRIRVVAVVALGTRRGPAEEAATLYDDRTPPSQPVPPRVGPRPTGRDRRRLTALKGDPEDL